MLEDTSWYLSHYYENGNLKKSISLIGNLDSTISGISQECPYIEIYKFKKIEQEGHGVLRRKILEAEHVLACVRIRFVNRDLFRDLQRSTSPVLPNEHSLMATFFHAAFQSNANGERVSKLEYTVPPVGETHIKKV